MLSVKKTTSASTDQLALPKMVNAIHQTPRSTTAEMSRPGNGGIRMTNIFSSPQVFFHQLQEESPITDMLKVNSYGPIPVPSPKVLPIRFMDQTNKLPQMTY